MWPRDNVTDLIAFYGDPARDAVEPQLVKVFPPFRMTYEGKVVDDGLSFHRLAAPALERALKRVWDYYGHDQTKLDALGISKTAGTYNKRFISGTERWSNHAFGAAIDINAEENGFNVEGNIPIPMIAAFKAEGARWGGDYRGRTDPMHFEFCQSGEPVRTFEQWLAFYNTPGGATVQPSERTPADVRRRMGQAITLAEARVDDQGRLMVYPLPANDGGGAYEVAGINERYHPVAAAKLKGLVEAGKDAEAKAFVGDYTGAYTDVADAWTSSWGIEFYLRDCVFNRGPTGSAYILQRALLLRGENLGDTGERNNGVDGQVGELTTAAMRRQEGNVDAMLLALRQAREDYEREDVGYRANFWNGLINRFNNALTVARRFHTEQPKGTTTMTDPQPQPPGPQPSPGTATPYNASIEDCLIDMAKAQRPILERYLKSSSPMTDEEKRRLVIMALGGTPPPSSPVLLPPPGAAPAAGTATPPAAPASSPTTVNISAALAGVLASLGLSATGVIGAPVGPDATTTGMLLPLLSMGVGALGIPAPVVSLLGTLFGRLFPAKTP